VTWKEIVAEPPTRRPSSKTPTGWNAGSAASSAAHWASCSSVAGCRGVAMSTPLGPWLTARSGPTFARAQRH